ncbi:hypothetical protein HDZ31DRAFT_76715 [Schizophyllum fasciatum]
MNVLNCRQVEETVADAPISTGPALDDGHEPTTPSAMCEQAAPQPALQDATEAEETPLDSATTPYLRPQGEDRPATQSVEERTGSEWPFLQASLKIAPLRASADEGRDSIMPPVTGEEIRAESGIGREVIGSRYSRSVTDLSKDGETPDTTTTFSRAAVSQITTITVTAEESSSSDAHGTGTSRRSPGMDNDLSPSYAALVTTWISYQRRMGWSNPKNGFSAKQRPRELSVWIKNSKPLHHDPMHHVKCVKRFSSAWLKWRQRLQGLGESAAGLNGWYLHLVSLKWWKLRGTVEEIEEWEEAVAEIHRDLNAFNNWP